MVYAISDLHLSLQVNKSMDVFGNRWTNYVEKIYKNWQKIVNRDDLVLIPGDISWAMKLNETYKDFEFIDSLNGTKLIIRGNHDYWWCTLKKIKKYASDNSFSTLNFLHNDSFVWSFNDNSKYDYIVISGTRGWSFSQKNGEHDQKILKHELQRLETSLKSAKANVEMLGKNGTDAQKIHQLVMMHYPPIDATRESDFLKIIKKYSLNHCVYGHLHESSYQKAIEGFVSGVNFNLVSCDYLNFEPFIVI